MVTFKIGDKVQFKSSGNAGRIVVVYHYGSASLYKVETEARPEGVLVKADKIRKA